MPSGEDSQIRQGDEPPGLHGSTKETPRGGAATGTPGTTPQWRPRGASCAGLAARCLEPPLRHGPGGRAGRAVTAGSAQVQQVSKNNPGQSHREAIPLTELSVAGPHGAGCLGPLVPWTPCWARGLAGVSVHTKPSTACWPLTSCLGLDFSHRLSSSLCWDTPGRLGEGEAWRGGEGGGVRVRGGLAGFFSAAARAWALQAEEKVWSLVVGSAVTWVHRLLSSGSECDVDKQAVGRGSPLLSGRGPRCCQRHLPPHRLQATSGKGQNLQEGTPGGRPLELRFRRGRRGPVGLGRDSRRTQMWPRAKRGRDTDRAWNPPVPKGRPRPFSLLPPLRSSLWAESAGPQQREPSRPSSRVPVPQGG